MLQRYRPNQSPILKTRKWSELKKSGCVAGLVGTIEIVMEGKTDCIPYHTSHAVGLYTRGMTTHEGDNIHISNCELVHDVPARDN
jgi:hypothetical protein